MLDYASSVFYGINQKKTFLRRALYLIPSCPIPVVFSNSCIGVQLNWLWKISNITFNTLYHSQPAYLHSLLHSRDPVRSLRSSTVNLQTVPFIRTVFGAHRFTVASPQIWNSLSIAFRTCTFHDSFYCYLNLTTSNKLSWSPSHHPIASDSTSVHCCARSYIYLLTYLLIFLSK